MKAYQIMNIILIYFITHIGVNYNKFNKYQKIIVSFRQKKWLKKEPHIIVYFFYEKVIHMASLTDSKELLDQIINHVNRNEN